MTLDYESLLRSIATDDAFQCAHGDGEECGLCLARAALAAEATLSRPPSHWEKLFRAWAAEHLAVCTAEACRDCVIARERKW